MCIRDSHRPVIYTIPVGSLASLPQNENRTPFSMITASRLATEKHIDWLVRAVVCAKKELPELSFDTVSYTHLDVYKRQIRKY